MTLMIGAFDDRDDVKSYRNYNKDQRRHDAQVKLLKTVIKLEVEVPTNLFTFFEANIVTLTISQIPT